jgi:hypothetical protein
MAFGGNDANRQKAAVNMINEPVLFVNTSGMVSRPVSQNFRLSCSGVRMNLKLKKQFLQFVVRKDFGLF